MATLPSATTRLVDQSGGVATGSDLLTVIAPVATNADITPRIWSNANDLYTYHGYSQGLDFCAMYFQATKLPVLFVGLPITTAGTVGRIDTTGNSDTCVVSVAVGGSGSLEETDGILKVVNGGTIATDQILLSLSLDGGRTYKPVRLGTNSSYTIPYVGLTLSFAAGDLTDDETVITWHSTAPKAGDTDIASAKTALAAGSKQSRAWLYIADCATSSDTSAIKTAVDAYETSDERYVVCKACLRDALPVASFSAELKRMSGSPNLTFADVGGTGDTIVRSGGSWVTDGFANGDYITVTGSVSNNVSNVKVTTVSALTLTLDTATLANEGPKSGCTVVSYPGLAFLEVGGTGDTITRSRGSFVADGFRSGDNFTVAGTSSNNITTTAGIDTVTATVITLDSDDLVTEGIDGSLVTITSGETDATCIATLDAAFSTVTSDPRLDLGYGRGAMLSPVTGYRLRRNVNWADMILAFQHDLGITTWWKELGPIHSRIPAGFDLNDADGQPYEHDERVTQGALAARFTCARTWGNGPAGAFIAQSLTREDDGSILGMTHNAYVASLAQTVCQATTELFAGRTVVLEPADETGARVATTSSLKQLEGRVNDELQRYLLSNIGGEGPRASVCKWTAATDDDLGVADATLHGTLELQVNGTLVHIDTSVQVS
jgi:hypothetical protein